MISEGHKEFTVLFLAFFGAGVKRHFHVLRGKRTFLEGTLLKMLDEAVEQDVDQDLACNVQERSTLVNVTTLAFAFPAVDVDYACIFVMGHSTHSTDWNSFVSVFIIVASSSLCSSAECVWSWRFAI